MMMDISAYLFSHVGNSRENQEDNALLVDGRYLTAKDAEQISASKQLYHIGCTHVQTDRFLAAVSDGMGGHACGEVASLNTVGFLSANYQRVVDSIMLGDKYLQAEIAALNRHVLAVAQSNRDYKSMGATLCGVVARDGAIWGFNVGDSRLYRFRGGQLAQLSTDHTEGQRLLGLRLLTEEEVKSFPRRKNVYKYIGMGGELTADIFRISDCTPGTTLLLCSDGLTDALSDADITAILTNEASAGRRGERLIEEALQRNLGRGDNITVILIEF